MIVAEYIPFIVLLFSLYTISGGIRIAGRLAGPCADEHVVHRASAALLASFIGTTGAAMLLVRPLLETNRERKHVAHTVVFFIFVVCNCGGLLLPLGDPPLFLGYLNGVDFLWTLIAVEELAVRQRPAAGGLFCLGPFLLLPARDEARHRGATRRSVRAAEVFRRVAQRAVAGGRGPVGGAAWIRAKPFPGTDVASLALSARDDAVGAGRAFR